MKNILLSLVMVAALVVAGVGGVFATLTDTEESTGNKIEVGSLDLKVNDEDDVNAWGSTGIGAVIVQECILPGTPMKTVFNVENEGCLDGYLYLVFKSLNCYNVEKEGAEGWIEDPNITVGAKMKPEPEMVSEYGGTLAQETIPGVGRLGDNCCLSSHTFVTAYYGTPAPSLQPAFLRPPPIIDNTVIGDLDNALTYCGLLPLCGGDWYLEFNFDVPQLTETLNDANHTWNWDFFNDCSPFDHWPTNALMADGISFKVMFILVDHVLTQTEEDAIMADIWD